MYLVLFLVIIFHVITCFRITRERRRSVLWSEVFDRNVQNRQDIKGMWNGRNFDDGDVTKISNDVVNSIINKGMNNSVNNLVNDSNIVEGSDYLKNHYAIPPTTLESLRKRYGKRKSVWGEWSNEETRNFYKQQLPHALKVDGVLGLTLKERAQLAAEARFALKNYARERCHLPGRVLSRIYDGVRHYQVFGYWSSEGMSVEKIKMKYKLEAIKVLGQEATEDEVDMYVYNRIVEKSCVTNKIFDELAAVGFSKAQIAELIKSMFEFTPVNTPKPNTSLQKIYTNIQKTDSVSVIVIAETIRAIIAAGLIK